MLINPSPMNILDYCNAFQGGDIKVDPNYQRTDRVWPEQARQYLIETIILGYPVPKFFLHQKIDLKSKKSMKFVVDGQQRSRAIIDYFMGRFSISKKSNAIQLAGKTFDMLDEDSQNAFLSYSLPIDLFVTASREEIIETFRRINSYTVPLNAEEKRHANHQGEMKWFIYDLATKYSEHLAMIGTLSEKNLARMVDFKFFSEMVCFINQGAILTTNAKLLDKLYAEYDKEFPNAARVKEKIDNAMAVIISWPWLQGLNVVKPHILEMILLALINESHIKTLRDEQRIKEEFADLSEAIEYGQSVEWAEFVAASSKTTNDKSRKIVIYDAVAKVLFE
jgi:Protein of unknown function DUF262